MHLMNPPTAPSDVEDPHRLTSSHLESLTAVRHNLHHVIVGIRGQTGAFPVGLKLAYAAQHVDDAINTLEGLVAAQRSGHAG